MFVVVGMPYSICFLGVGEGEGRYVYIVDDRNVAGFQDSSAEVKFEILNGTGPKLLYQFCPSTSFAGSKFMAFQKKLI